jgi:pimeloyl-ACP methyl ester carboxylesterase
VLHRLTEHSGFVRIDPANKFGAANQPILSIDLADEMSTPTIPEDPSGWPTKNLGRLFNRYPVASCAVPLRNGFVGGLNYYRNVDRNWALTPFLEGARLRQPTLLITGDRDGVLDFWGEHVEAIERNVPNLRKKLILPGVGHWTQQESSDAVNRALIEFLNEL